MLLYLHTVQAACNDSRREFGISAGQSTLSFCSTATRSQCRRPESRLRRSSRIRIVLLDIKGGTRNVSQSSNTTQSDCLSTFCQRSRLTFQSQWRIQKIVLGGEGGLGVCPQLGCRGEFPSWSINAFCVMVRAFL